MASTHKPPNPSSVANHRTRTASFVALLGVLAVPFLPYVYRYTPVLHHLPVRLPFLSTIGPTVHLDYGSFGGRAGDANGIEQFLGVPYAAPPTGKLRFAAPQPPVVSTRIRMATAYGPGCHPQTLTMNPELKLKQPEVDAEVRSEDCLTVNVFKPAGTTVESKLPVIFFIHGGGFAIGTTSRMDAGLQFVNRTMALGKPIVYVSANYRTNAFGFLAGEAIEAEGGLNAGLQDQRMALRWVQKYVHLFGGDPTKVTVWGQSAGAISIGLHLVANGGNNEGLFRGAVMQSGAPAPLGTRADGQLYFDMLADFTGCSKPDSTSTSSSNSSSMGLSKTKLACLRSLPDSTLVSAINRTPNLFGYSSIKLAWVPRVDGALFEEDPVESVKWGRVTNVPFISGFCDDEGTLFSLNSLNVTTNAQFVEYIKYLANLDDNQASRLERVYPDDPVMGSPYDTGDEHILSPQYKRIASFQGDWVFIGPTKHLLRSTTRTHTSWSYSYKRFKHRSFLGSSHGTDFSALRADPRGYDFLLNFAYNLNPNEALHPDSALAVHWPRYGSTQEGVAMVLKDGDDVVIEQDGWRRDVYEALTSIQLELGKGSK